MSEPKSWFVHDQQWSVLRATEDRKSVLSNLKESASTGSEYENNNGESPWLALENWETVVDDDRSLLDDKGNSIRFRRVILTSAAGHGKSKSSEWLEHRINHPQEESLNSETAFYFQIRTFLNRRASDPWTIVEQLFDELTNLWFLECGDQFDTDKESAKKQIRQYVLQAARQGALCLIFDGLDQADEEDWKPIFWLLESREFRRCRFILAGRPSKICGKWNQLTEKEYWTFIRVHDFDTRQQVRYLGWLPVGVGDNLSKSQIERIRFNAINRDARGILNVPRVLWYLRNRNNFSKIRTACDVYDYAIDHLITDGLKLCMPEQERVDATMVQTIKKILAVTAYETMMVCQDFIATFRRDPSDPTQLMQQPSLPTDSVPEYVYDIDVEDGDFDRAKENIKTRWSNEATTFEEYWTLLGRMNAFLEQGLFENDQEGLNRIVWSNRSLHEYCLALYFAKYSRDGEESILWDWLHIHHQSDTDQYYPFWQFFTEMPSKSRDSKRWLSACELLFWPNIRYEDPPETTDPDNPRYPYFAKRSCEMIYRSWETLDQYCQSGKSEVHKRANRIRDRWFSEFEGTLLAGKLGDEFAEIAREVQNDLITIDGGTLHMGTTWEKQVPEDYIVSVRNQLQEFADSLQPKSVDADPISKLLDQYSNNSRAGIEFRERFEPIARTYANRYLHATDKATREQVVRGYIRDFYDLGNEIESPDIEVSSFLLASKPTLNRHFRLFDSGHGPDSISNYKDYSETEQHPAIGLNFFHVWVYCKWLHWEGESCRLPFETEWEFAAKKSLSDWTQGYWWDDSFFPERDREKINCRENWPEDSEGHSLVCDSKRMDPTTGLFDMHGNVWEWCQDEYRFRHEEGNQLADQQINPFVRRVLRGGSFDYSAFNARCSFRLHSYPSSAGNNGGCRVSRAKNP